MAAMDIIAIPSVWQEAFPYAALEAMSLGRPILGSCVGGIPELVQDGETGLLFENRNSAQLSTLIQGLSERRSELVRMGETGQTRYQENYTVPHMAARIEKVYQNVLSQASVVPSSRKLA
jgi:glycosyltransferase involved in cell wall biosynthesis